MHFIMTPSYSAQTLLIEGSDAITFAQSQFSSNVTALPRGRWQFSAWLDAQGGVRALFHLARIDESRLLLLLRGGDATRLAAELRRFVLRAKVELTAASGSTLSSGQAMPMFEVRHEHDTLRLGCGEYTFICGDNTSDDESWQEHQMHDGWAWLPESICGRLLPPALSLYRLSAVALDKGCYPGQEIVSRLHYRGGHKRHLHRVTLSQPTHQGTTLHIDGQEAAWLLQTRVHESGIEALAVLPDGIAEQFRRDESIQIDEGAKIRIVTSWND